MSDKLRGDNSGQYQAATAASATFSCSLPGMRHADHSQSGNLSQVGPSQSANPCTTLYGVQTHDSSAHCVSEKGQTLVPRHSNVQSELEMAFQRRLRQPKKKFPKEAPNSSSSSANTTKSPPPQVNNVPPDSSTVSSASVPSPSPSPSQPQPQKHSHFSPSSPTPPPRSSSLHKTIDTPTINGQTQNIGLTGYRKVTARGIRTPRSFNQDFSDYTDSEDCRTPDVSIFNMSEGYRTPLESEDEADTASKHSYAASSTRFPFKSEVVKQFEKPVPVFLKCQSWCNQLPDDTESRQPVNDPNLSKELQNIESFESAMLDWFQTLNRTNDDDDLRSETSVSSMGSCKSEYRLRSLINNRFQNSEQIENVLTDLLAISDQYAQVTDTESIASESQKSVQTLNLQKTSQPRRGRATVVRRSSFPGDVSGSESESEPPRKRGGYKTVLSELQGVLRQRRPFPEAPDSEESGLGSSEYSNPPTSPLSPTSIPPTLPKPQFPTVHAPRAAKTAKVTHKPLVNAGDFKFLLGELSTAWSKRLKRIRKAQMVSQRGMQSSLYANFQGFRIPETLIEDKSTKYAHFQGKLEPAEIVNLEPETRTNINKESDPKSESVSKPMFCKTRGQGNERQVLPSEIAKKEQVSKPQKPIEPEPAPLKEMTGQELLESVQKPGLRKTTFRMNKYIRNVASGGALPEITEEISIPSPSQRKLVSALNKGAVLVSTSIHNGALQSMQCQVPSPSPGQMNFLPQASQAKSPSATQFTNVRSPPPGYIQSVSPAPIQSPLVSHVKSPASITSQGAHVHSPSSSELPHIRSSPSPQVNSPISSTQVSPPLLKVRPIPSLPEAQVWSPPSRAQPSPPTQIKSSIPFQQTPPLPSNATISPPPPPPQTVRLAYSPPPPVQVRAPPPPVQVRAPPPPVQVRAPPQIPIPPPPPPPPPPLISETLVNNAVIPSTQIKVEPSKHPVPMLLPHSRQGSAFTVPPSRSRNTSDLTEKIHKIKAGNIRVSPDPMIRKTLMDGVTDLSEQLKSTITEVVKKTEENQPNDFPANKYISSPSFTSSENVTLNSKVLFAAKPVRSSPVISRSRSITPTTNIYMDPALIEEKRLILERLTKIGERNIISKEEIPELPMDIMKASSIKIQPLLTENLDRLVCNVREESREGSPMIDEMRHLKKSEVVMEITSPMESPTGEKQSKPLRDMNLPLVPSEPGVSESQILLEKSMLSRDKPDEAMETPIPETGSPMTDLMPEITHGVDFENNVGFLDNQSENKPEGCVSNTELDSLMETPIPETGSATVLMPEIAYSIDLENNVGFLNSQSADRNKPEGCISHAVLDSLMDTPIPETGSPATDLMPEIAYNVDLENNIGFLVNQSAADENKSDSSVSHTLLDLLIETSIPETSYPATDLMPEIAYDVDLENNIGFLEKKFAADDENTSEVCVSHTELDSLMETVLLSIETMDNLLPDGEMQAEEETLAASEDKQFRKMNVDSVVSSVSLPEGPAFLEVKELNNPTIENSTEIYVVTLQENESLEMTQTELMEGSLVEKDSIDSKEFLEEKDSGETMGSLVEKGSHDIKEFLEEKNFGEIMEFLVETDSVEIKKSLSETDYEGFKESSEMVESLEKNDSQEMETCELLPLAAFVGELSNDITPTINEVDFAETFEVSVGENEPFNGGDVPYSIIFDNSVDTMIPSEEELESLWINPAGSLPEESAVGSELMIVKEGDAMLEEVMHVDIQSDEAVTASESVLETISTETTESIAMTNLVETKPGLETVTDIATTTHPELILDWSTVPDVETEKLLSSPEVSTVGLQTAEALSLEEVSNYTVYSDNITDAVTVPNKITEFAQQSNFIPVFSPLKPEMPVFENPPNAFVIPVQEVVSTVIDAGAFVEISEQKEILFAPSEQEESLLRCEPEMSFDQLKQSIKEEMLKSEDITKVFALETLKSFGPNGSPDDHEYEDAVCYSSDDSLTFEDTLTSPIMSRRVYKEVVRAEIGSRVETLQSWAKPEPLKSWPNQENLQLCSGEDPVEDSNPEEFHEAEETISNTDADVPLDSDQQQLVYTLPTIYEATEESVEEERRILREINHVDQLIGECVETLEMSPVELAQVQEQDPILCDAQIPDFISEMESERDVQLGSVFANLKNGAPFSASCASSESTTLFGELKRSQGLTALDQICTDQSPESQVQNGSPPEKVSDHTSPEIFSDDEMLHSIPYNVTIEKPEPFEEEILPAMSRKTIFDKMGVGKILEEEKFEETEDEISPAYTRSDKTSEDEISPAHTRSEKTSEDEAESVEAWIEETGQADLQLPRVVLTQQPLADKFENLLEYLESDAAKELQEFERIESACEILSKDHRKDSVVSDFSIGNIGKSDDFELLIRSLDSELEEDMTQNVLTNPKEDLVPGVVMIPPDEDHQQMDTFDYKNDPEDDVNQIKAFRNLPSKDDFFDAYSETEYSEYMLSRDPEDSGYIDAVPLQDTSEIEFEQMMTLKQSMMCHPESASPNMFPSQADEGIDEDDQCYIDSNYLSYMREREMETYELLTAKVPVTVTDIQNAALPAVDGKSTPTRELVITVPESEQEHGTVPEDIFLVPDSSVEASEKPLFISDEIEEEFFTIKGTEHTVEQAFEYLLSSKTVSLKEDNDTSPDPKTDHSLTPVENSGSMSEDPLSPGNYIISHQTDESPEIEVHKLCKPVKKHARKSKKDKVSKDGSILVTETNSQNSSKQESIVSSCTSKAKVMDTEKPLEDSLPPRITRSTSSSSTERSASCEHAILPPGSVPLSEDLKDTTTTSKKKRKKKKKKDKEKEEPLSPSTDFIEPLLQDSEKLHSDQVEFNVEMDHKSNIVAEISEKEAIDDIHNDSKYSAMDSERNDFTGEISMKDQASDLPMPSLAISEEMAPHLLASESATSIIKNETSLEKEAVPPSDFIPESSVMAPALQEMSAISSESAEEVSYSVMAPNLQEMPVMSSESAEEVSYSVMAPALQEMPPVSSESAEVVSSVMVPALQKMPAMSSESAEEVSSSVMAPVLQEMPAMSSELAEEVSSLIMARVLQEMSVISSESAEEVSSSVMAPALQQMSAMSSESAEEVSSSVMTPALQEMSALSSESAEEVSSSVMTPALQEMSAVSSESAEEVSFSVMAPAFQEVPAMSSESAEEVSSLVMAPNLQEMPAMSSELAEEVSSLIMTHALQEMSAISSKAAEEVSSSVMAPALQEMSAVSSESAEEVSSSVMAPALQEMLAISSESAEEVSSSVMAPALQEMPAISSQSADEILSEKEDAVTGKFSEVTLSLSSALEILDQVDHDTNSAVSLNQAESSSELITNTIKDSNQSIIAVVVPETPIDVPIWETSTKKPAPLAPHLESEQTLPIVSPASEYSTPIIPNLETSKAELDSVTSVQQPVPVAPLLSSSTTTTKQPAPMASPPSSPSPSSSKQAAPVALPPSTSSKRPSPIDPPLVSSSKQPAPVTPAPLTPPKQPACIAPVLPWPPKQPTPIATSTAPSPKESVHFAPLLSSATRSSSLSSLSNRECHIHRYGVKCPIKPIEYRTDFSESYQKKAAFLASLPRPVDPLLYRCPSSESRFGQPPPLPCSLRDMEAPQPPVRKNSKDDALSDSLKSESDAGAPLCAPEDTKLASPILERSKNTSKNGLDESSTLTKSPQSMTRTNSPTKRFRDLKHFSRISNMTYNEVIEMEEEEHRRRYDFGTNRRLREMKYFGRICHGDSEESMISKKSESSDSGILTGYRDLKQSRTMTTSSTSLQAPGASAAGGRQPKGLADSAVSIDNPRVFEPVMSYVAYGQSGDTTTAEMQRYSSSGSSRSNTLQPSDRHRQDLGAYGQIQKAHDMVRSTQSLDYHAGHSKFVHPEIGLSEQEVTSQGFQDSGLCASNYSVSGQESDDSRSMRSSLSFVIPEHRTVENIVMDDDSESIYEDVAMYPNSDTMSMRSDVGSVKSLSKLKKFGSKLKKFSKIKFKKFWK